MAVFNVIPPVPLQIRSLQTWSSHYTYSVTRPYLVLLPLSRDININGSNGMKIITLWSTFKALPVLNKIIKALQRNFTLACCLKITNPMYYIPIIS